MVLQEISEELYNRSYLRSIDLWMLELVIVSFMIYIILDFKIYRHQILVILIILIICFPLKCIDFCYQWFNADSNYSDDNNVNGKTIHKNVYTYNIYKKHFWFVPFGILV
jgi:hypothetical protein